MKRCIFCEIAQGESAAYIIYKSKKAICMLDANPIAKGHCLIIPKKHFKNIYDIQKDYLKEVMIVAKKVSALLKKKLNATGVNILHASGKSAQQSLFHFHIHLVPRYEKDNLNTWPKSRYKEKNFKKIYDTIKS